MYEIRQLKVQFSTRVAVTFILKGLSDVICRNAFILTQVVISHAARKRCALCVCRLSGLVNHAGLRSYLYLGP